MAEMSLGEEEELVRVMVRGIVLWMKGWEIRGGGTHVSLHLNAPKGPVFFFVERGSWRLC